MEIRDEIREKLIEILDLNNVSIGAILSANVTEVLPVVTVLRMVEREIYEVMGMMELPL